MTPRIRFDVITLFPELVSAWAAAGVCGRAVSRGLVECHLINPRRFAHDVHQTVDDRPYGGGPGMVMLAEPLQAAVVEAKQAATQSGWIPGAVILFSPAGEVLDQGWVEAALLPIRAAAGAHDSARCQWTLVCGRYEGVDQRFIDQCVDIEMSLGDFVLSGGEIAAMALIDAMTRRLPGALGDDASSDQDSFINGHLDHPHYTRPEVFGDQGVPDVLLSGHHGKIRDWRAAAAQLLTKARRPDLWSQAQQKAQQEARQEARQDAVQEKP